MISLKELVNDLPVKVVQGELNIPIAGIHYDSRKIEKEFLFVCISGFKADGHDFIPQALNNGARAIIVEHDVNIPSEITVLKINNARKALPIISSKFYKNPATNFNLIGVTGTNGKTTTTFLIESILVEDGKKVGLIGTIENRIGEQAFSVTHTTPESLELQKLFNLMTEEEVDYGVMEVSSHALDLGRVDIVEYDIAVFTNLTQDHLDYHPNMEDYLRAKSILFTNLGKTNYKKRNKFGVVNGDDPYSKKIVNKAQVPIVTYGIKTSNDVWASEVQIKATGVSFNVNFGEESFKLSLRLTGLFSVYNALAATAVCLKEGIKPAVIKKALEKLTGVAGRFESVIAGQDFSVIVDYAHTPDSLENILVTAKEFAEGKIITVFGCGGDRDITKRPLMGEKAGQYSDYCIITSDNPRTEEPDQIIAHIIPGVAKFKDKTRYEIIENRKKAIEAAIKMAQANDIIIIAGKGHETYQIVGDQVYPFDDRLVAKEVLEELGYDNI
ncbi:MAG: UDP-N-acetylmuramoyl-L-alanyl-D-glutamate--2,6-diaminopimelate ligase [Bacillota bacterium]|nr:UDP-N-acetylmuramoyl-L-alanyl-D-glutamate--2,6-diaminopimelate ligase [Bacillota bacterium]